MGKSAKPVKKNYTAFEGFDSRLTPQQIIDMKQSTVGRTYFLVKWKNKKNPTYLTAEVAKKRFPTLVCEFYQKHIVAVHTIDPAQP